MKLNENQVRLIKGAIACGVKQEDIADSYGVTRSSISNIACGRQWAHVAAPLSVKQKPAKPGPVTALQILSLLRRGRQTTAGIVDATNGEPRQVESLIATMQDGGALIYKFGDFWSLEKTPAPSSGQRHVYEARQDGSYYFGFCGDSHLGSKYERLDVLHDLYDKFAAAGVDRVYHTGNWIEGEARFNKFDISVYGMDAQCNYLAANYPTKPGLVTYAVAGDDHEGWYGQREGVDIGKHAERIMRENGREDWINLGYMEAFVELRHKNGSGSQMLVMHPGGGSSYAYSYRPQKIVEHFSGGEKPGVLVMGHYHKMSFDIIRNVWTIQAGCSQDQTPFMRKKGIDAHVGGGICKLSQDERGAIVGCQVEFFAYYNVGYYNNRWNHGGSVTLPKRGRIVTASKKKKELATR